MIGGVEWRHLWVPPPMPSVVPDFDLLAAESLSAALLSLSPSLYWDLGINGATDLSGHSRDGIPRGSPNITIGSGESMTPDTAEGSTVFPGTGGKFISSGYTFTGSSPTTFFWLASRSGVTLDSMLGQSNGSAVINGNFPSSASVLIELLASPSNRLTFDPTGGVANWDVWPGSDQVVVCTLVFDDAANTAEFFVNGVSAGVVTDAAFAYPVASGEHFEVGGISTAPFAGSLAHVALYPAKLTAAKIAALSVLAHSRPVTLNRRRDDDGVDVFPRYMVDHTTGLMSSGESGDRRDNKVRAQGEIPRRSFRRGKTITYEGLTQATTRAELREAEATLSAAFDDQTGEGLVIATPHPDNPDYDSGDFSYYPAKAITCEIDDEITFSPRRPNTHGHESPFVIALRHARAGGVGHTDQDGVDYP
jgi:hypothetical protein